MDFGAAHARLSFARKRRGPNCEGGSRGQRSRAAALAIFLAPLAACQTLPVPCVRPSGLRAIDINSRPESNDGRPIAIDLVYVTAKPAAAAISKLRARDYFALHDQLLRDYPRDVRTRRWEIQAGQQVAASKVTPPCGLHGTYLFASYQSAGDHRISVGKAKAGALTLGEQEIAWTPK